MIPLYLTRGGLAAAQLAADWAPLEFTGTSDVRNLIRFADEIELHSPFVDGESAALYEVEDIGISPAYDAVVEPQADRDGSIGGEPREVQKLITIRGFVRAGSIEMLMDAIVDLNRAFHPVLSYNQDLEDGSTADIGFRELNFLFPTESSPGYIYQRYYVRPINLPVPITTKFDDLNARFNIILLAVDPRRYKQTLSTASRTGNGTLTINNLEATYPSWPEVRIAFTTIPASDITYQYTTAGAPIIESGRVVTLESTELADSAGETLVIEHQHRRAYYNDDEEDKTGALKVTSRFFEIQPVSHTLTFAGLPSDAVVTVNWRKAFA